MAADLLIASLLLLALASPPQVCKEDICPHIWVRDTQRGDGICDPSCNTLACGFDVASELDFLAGDCSQVCSAAQVSPFSLGNGACDKPILSTDECGLDAGDCGYCAEHCNAHSGFESDLKDGICTEACNSPSCAWDAGDCVSYM